MFKKYIMWIYFLIFLIILLLYSVNNSNTFAMEEHFTTQQVNDALDSVHQIKNALNDQSVIGNKSQNEGFEEPKNIKLNNTYEILKKDPVEPDIRAKAEKDYGYKHERPNVRNPFQTDGYSVINPALWDVPQQRPPICIPQKGYEATVQPTPTSGTPLEALEWKEVLPRFTYNQVYDPKYYYPGYESL